MEKGNTRQLESIYQKIREKAKSDPAFLLKMKKGDKSALESINCDRDEKRILDILKKEISVNSCNGIIDDAELEKVAGGFLRDLFDDIGKILKDVLKSDHRSCS